MLEACTCYKILNSGYDQEEAARRFKMQPDLMKSYFFQFYLWPESCSIRYNIHSVFIFLLAIFYLIIIYIGISRNIFDDLEQDALVSTMLQMALLWISTITCGNIMEFVYAKLTKREVSFDFTLIMDFMLLIGVII